MRAQEIAEIVATALEKLPGKKPRIVWDNFYQARELLADWVRYYNEERLHSALKYLRPVDYDRGNPEVLLAERRRKLREAAARRRG